jgi:hypothetical protein
LNEIEEFHTRGQGIAASNAHDQAEVGTNETILRYRCSTDFRLQGDRSLAVLEACRGSNAFLDGLRKFTLFERGEKGDKTDFVEVLAD